ncbi:cation-translocating P-type ATPase [Methanobacterium aggregans]|uniref:cation-translocating P-type ATPase n=1 Tax=Methanobacterium aggregans TaxID=1615586 RepID=UPI001AEB41D1|nr:cation-transporting P-type ATPase [Methanobacterium aggregans]MBP2046077.1 magnesium-transporting ATPase (P-type) [Methanobacterium aggregans]
MKIYQIPPEDVYIELKTSKEGLTDSEAEKRLEEYGLNQIEEVKRKPIIYNFLANLYQLLALLLWAASILAFISGTPQLGFAIIAVIIINAVFSFWQEYEAEKAVEALKKILPSSAKVIRGGEEVVVLASQLVPGDVLVLEEGDNVSADARLVEAFQMKVDTSTLTGESKPIRKVSDTIVQDDEVIVGFNNLVLAGTSVSSGSGRAVVFSTGSETEFNKIASLTQAVKEEPSPLQKQMNRLTQIIAVIAIFMGVTLFLLNVYVVELPLSLAFTFAIGLTVANVPEGLLPTVTLALAASVKKMVGKNALIKRLSSVETLGSTNIICTDKTGTITKNEMTVRKIWIPHEIIDVTGAGYEPEGEFFHGGVPVSHQEVRELKLLMRSATFCNDAKLIKPEGPDEKWKILGDPTEAALLIAARKNGFDWEDEMKKSPRIAELPFDSKRKSMSSIHQKHGEKNHYGFNDERNDERNDEKKEYDKNIENGELFDSETNPEGFEQGSKVAYVKGAPKKIIALCKKISVDGKVQTFSDEEKEEIIKKHDELAASGLRILGMAYKTLPDDFNDFRPETVEVDMVFLGMMAMQDPPRPEVKGAVEDCHRAGIRIIMITGDYGLTARSIASEVGIVGSECNIIKGKELDSLSDDEVKKVLKSGSNIIFARAIPEHKMRIASILESENEIVAMTGDGVNDAPALRRADIGVAMGITGTDVAKEASDMVLTDDNFATIVAAIKEGRTIYENIRKFITYIFAHETAEIIPFILMVIFRIPLPITVMQILAIDLGTDTLPALALGMGPSEADVMERPPRPKKERILNLQVIMRGYIFLGVIEAILVMSGYFWVLYNGGWQLGQSLPFSDPLYMKATTMVFAGIVTSQIGNLLGCQTTRTSTLKVGVFKNKWIIRGIMFEVLVVLSIVYIPYMQEIFGTTSLGIFEWLYLISFIPIMFFAEELRKYIARRVRK